jgi:hypothetical protein
MAIHANRAMKAVLDRKLIFLRKVINSAGLIQASMALEHRKATNGVFEI